MKLENDNDTFPIDEWFNGIYFQSQMFIFYEESETDTAELIFSINLN